MDYDGAVELIKKTEAYDTAQRAIMVNLTDFDDKIPLKEYNYREVASLVTFVDRVDASQSGPKGTSQAGAPQPDVPTQPAGMTHISMPNAAEQMAPQPQAQRSAQAPAAKSAGGLSAAAAELREAVSHIESSVGSIREKRSTEKLVLPNLSLSDQLNELEKINLGIDGSIFNAEQLEIIKTEIKGLAKTALKHKQPPADQKDMMELRDKRLKEVLIKLGIK